MVRHASVIGMGEAETMCGKYRLYFDPHPARSVYDQYIFNSSCSGVL